MMLLVWGFIILLLSVSLGVWISANPGYVLWVGPSFTIEVPIWFVMVTLLIAIGLLCIILWSLFRTRQSLESLSDWRAKRRAQRIWRHTQVGLMALHAGSWKWAEKELTRYAKESDVPALNYLAAAQAASEQMKIQEYEQYLELAASYDQDYPIAIGLAKINLLFSQKRFTEALAELENLQTIESNHPEILKWLQKVYVQLEQWAALLRLIPRLQRAGIYSAAACEALEKDAYIYWFTQAKQQMDLHTLQRYWNQMSPVLRQDERIIDLYAEQFLIHQQANQAEQIIRQYLKYRWSELLMNRYGKILSDEPEKQLKCAESWLAEHESAQLYLALARICCHNHQWDKAKEYYQSAINLNPSSETYIELGDWYYRIGGERQAMEQYRQALQSLREYQDHLVPKA